MCLSVPKQIVAWEGDGSFTWVERHGERECINMLLLGAQPVGTWILTSLGLAREILDDSSRTRIEEALAALASALDGDYDPSHHFQDLQHP